MAIVKGNVVTAIETARQLDRIGFSEFTTKLVTDIFDALVKNNIAQMEAYAEFLNSVSGTVQDLINETEDDVSAQELIEMLEKLNIGTEKIQALVAVEDTEGTALNAVSEPLEQEDINKINQQIVTPLNEAGIKDGGNNIPQVGLGSNISVLVSAIAKRVAQGKYQILKELVKIGLIRTVVDNGTIRTKLEFETVDISREVVNQYKSNVSRKGFQGRIGGTWKGLLFKGALGLSGGIGGGRSKIAVKTVNRNNFDMASTNIDILGEVVINFRTDQLSLSDD